MQQSSTSRINIQNKLLHGSNLRSLICKISQKRRNVLFPAKAVCKQLSSQAKSHEGNQSSYITRYINIWRNNPLPIWIGLLLIAALHYRRRRKEKKHHEEPLIMEQVEARPISLWLVQAYEQMPLDFLSRIVGYILNDITLPVWAREPVISWYANMFQCKMHEAEKGDDWVQYNTLGDFFRRRLKKGARPINEEAILTAPCDGRVLSCGPIDCHGKLEQVKGGSYSLKEFLGEYLAPLPANDSTGSRKSHYIPKEHTRLYHCTMYLAPGDYHCFHAPTDWTVELRRHFIGKLLSVRPSLMGKIPHLLSLNERVVYFGKWYPALNTNKLQEDKDGYFFAFAAVGATNVGSILVEMDDALKTNEKGKFKKNKYIEEHLFNHENFMKIKKGAYFGEFNLGSTIVIVIEAPMDFTFNVENGQKVFVGQPLAHKKQTD